jgi:pSer/pThr/pTyr-binding forkhead associated (FHA) protein
MSTAGEPSRGIPAGTRLRVLRGFYEGLEVPVDREWLVIGRGRGADLGVAEPTISRQHAAVGWDGEGFYLQDLGSTNGTKLNGRRATRARLRDGDEIELGRLALRLHAPAGEEARG